MRNLADARFSEMLLGKLLISGERYADGERHLDQAFSLMGAPPGDKLANIEAFLNTLDNDGRIAEMSGQPQGAERYFSCELKYIERTLAENPSVNGLVALQKRASKQLHTHYVRAGNSTEAAALRKRYPHLESI